MQRSRALLAMTLVVATASPAAGRAAPTEVEDPRAAEARRACAAGRVERGIELLAAIIAESGDVNAVYNQARCYQQNGRPEEAILRFREYLRVGATIPAAEREQVLGFIREQEAEIDARNRRNALALGTPIGAAIDEAAPAPVDRVLRTAALATAGAGVAAFAAGAAFGWRTRSIRQELERPDPIIDRHEFDDLVRRGERAHTLQWVGYGVGAAALAGSAFLYWLSRPGRTDIATATVAPMVGKHGAGALVSGRF